jgi:hypothetical protein
VARRPPNDRDAASARRILGHVRRHRIPPNRVHTAAGVVILVATERLWPEPPLRGSAQ